MLTRDESRSKLPLVGSQGLVMNYQDEINHREREEDCRSMAELASEPDVRRRHDELAELHAVRASLYPKSAKPGSPSAAN